MWELKRYKVDKSMMKVEKIKEKRLKEETTVKKPI